MPDLQLMIAHCCVRYDSCCVIEKQLAKVLAFCCFVNVQDAQQQRLCTQEASILQMKQELLRASMTKDELNNQNVRNSLKHKSDFLFK